jgi:hypothetical protein
MLDGDSFSSRPLFDCVGCVTQNRNSVIEILPVRLYFNPIRRTTDRRTSFKSSNRLAVLETVALAFASGYSDGVALRFASGSGLFRTV